MIRHRVDVGEVLLLRGLTRRVRCFSDSFARPSGRQEAKRLGWTPRLLEALGGEVGVPQVMVSEACPSRSCSSLRLAPRIMAHEANVWRRVLLAALPGLGQLQHATVQVDPIPGEPVQLGQEQAGVERQDDTVPQFAARGPVAGGQEPPPGRISWRPRLTK